MNINRSRDEKRYYRRRGWNVHHGVAVAAATFFLNQPNVVEASGASFAARGATKSVDPLLTDRCDLLYMYYYLQVSFMFLSM